MAAFDELDWDRFDVWAAVAHEGLMVVATMQREACHAWLQKNDYTVTSFDFALGIGPAVVAMGEYFRWEEQFGYRLTLESRSLDALRDGFDFGLMPGGRHVLELLNADVAHREDARWLTGLLAIASEHSRQQLALGARFFATLFLDQSSPIVGMRYETLRNQGKTPAFASAGRRGSTISPSRPDRRHGQQRMPAGIAAMAKRLRRGSGGTMRA